MKVKLIVLPIVVLFSCNSRNEGPACYYVGQEKVLAIDSINVAFDFIDINIYCDSLYSEVKSSTHLFFKNTTFINSIDFDEIDTTMFELTSEKKLVEIRNSKYLGFSSISLKSHSNKFYSRKLYPNFDLESVTKSKGYYEKNRIFGKIFENHVKIEF